MSIERAVATLSASDVRAQLRTAHYGHSLRLLDETSSTNDQAKRDAQSGAVRGHTVVADMQHAGRGSQGRVWSSPKGLDLYVSIVDRPAVSFADLPPLTLAVGLGVSDAVDTLLGRPRSQVKWPNDVWIDRKKCAGILIEASASGSTLDSVVIGIGLNVNRADFPDDLAKSATSLRLANDERAAIARSDALSTLLFHVETWVERFVARGPSALIEPLEARLAMRGERARCSESIGVVRGISASGALRFQTAEGVHEVVSGRLLPLDEAYEGLA